LQSAVEQFVKKILPTVRFYFSPLYYKNGIAGILKLFPLFFCFHFYIINKQKNKNNMKKLFFSFIAALFISLTGMAQVSESINYQAVARNNAGAALAGQTIKVRLTISRNAVTQYSETRQVTTNALGLFNVQIGSSGALATTGTFTAIDWMNNTPNMLLKVELDINNSNVFTDMGFQAFSSVPFAMAAKKSFEADNTLKIAGRPLDVVTTPSTNSTLVWNGTNWTPVKRDTVIIRNNLSTLIPAVGGSVPWVFIDINTNLATITVTGSETIIGHVNGSFRHGSATETVLASTSMCYQEVSSGAVTSFATTFPYAIEIRPSALPGGSAQLTAIGAVKLPAGTYRIGMGIKNLSTTTNILNGGYYNSVIEIKH
jgi:uncharacterized membrane protein (GlpM family)